MSSEYERKLIDMQYQMRENNSYLNDYMKDLDNWTDEIKKKEETLQSSSSLTSTKDLPPVRNFVEPSKPKKKSQKKDSSGQTAAAPIRSFDYRSWEKYDVDAECERVDSAQENGGNADDELEDDDDNEEWQKEVSEKKAEYYKDCGNYLFKQKSYAEAIEQYTKAIECNPLSHVYFANRAQCQLFEQRYGACEADCTLAIQLNQSYVKAYYRRALARMKLDKIDLARQDLEYVLAHEPSNVDAKNKLDEVNRNDEIKRLGRVYPLADKPEDQRSTKPLKRIDIQEIDTSFIASSEPTTKKKSIVIEEMETTPSSTEPSVQSALPPPPTSSASSSQPQKPATMQKPLSKPVSIPTAIPTTGFQFKRDWSNLNNQLEQQAMYFNQIPPTSYKTIFSTGLDSSVFSRVLLVWSNRTNIDEHLINSMYEIRRTPRFKTQLSFLDQTDQQLLKTTLQRLENQPLPLLSEKIQTILHDYKSD